MIDSYTIQDWEPVCSVERCLSYTLNRWESQPMSKFREQCVDAWSLLQFHQASVGADPAISGDLLSLREGPHKILA